MKLILWNFYFSVAKIILTLNLVKGESTTDNPDYYDCSEEGLFPDYHLDPCIDYYQCIYISKQWFYHPHSCKNGSIFNVHTQSCKENYQCNYGTVPSETTKDIELTSVSPPSTFQTTLEDFTSQTTNVDASTWATSLEPLNPKPVTTTSEPTTIKTPETPTSTQRPTTTTLRSTITTKRPTITTRRPTTTITTKRPTTTITTKRPTTTITTKRPTTTITTKRPTTTITTKRPTTTITTKRPTTTITTKRPTTTITTKRPTTTITTKKPTTTITTKRPTTTKKPTTTKLPETFQCTSAGYFGDLKICSIYHSCIKNFNEWVHYEMPCPAGLVYCAKYGYCGWKSDCPDIPCLN